MTEILYDRIGRSYAAVRRAEPRFEWRIREALGDARSVVNVGAGTARTSRATFRCSRSSRPR